MFWRDSGAIYCSIYKRCIAATIARIWIPNLGHLGSVDMSGHRSRQSQNVRHFGLGDIGEQNCDVKHKQSQLIGMDSVSDICKYHLLCFATITEVKVMSGHQVKKVQQKKS